MPLYIGKRNAKTCEINPLPYFRQTSKDPRILPVSSLGVPLATNPFGRTASVPSILTISISSRWYFPNTGSLETRLEYFPVLFLRRALAISLPGSAGDGNGIRKKPLLKPSGPLKYGFQTDLLDSTLWSLANWYFRSRSGRRACSGFSSQPW